MHRKRADMQVIVMDLNKSINPISLVVGMVIYTIFNSFLVVVQVTRECLAIHDNIFECSASSGAVKL